VVDILDAADDLVRTVGRALTLALVSIDVHLLVSVLLGWLATEAASRLSAAEAACHA
jgi:hypothetical protein